MTVWTPYDSSVRKGYAPMCHLMVAVKHLVNYDSHLRWHLLTKKIWLRGTWVTYTYKPAVEKALTATPPHPVLSSINPHGYIVF